MSYHLLLFPPSPPIGFSLAAASFLVTGFCENPVLTLNVSRPVPEQTRLTHAFLLLGSSLRQPRVHARGSRVWTPSARTSLGLVLEVLSSGSGPGVREAAMTTALVFRVCRGDGVGAVHSRPLHSVRPTDAFGGLSGPWEWVRAQGCSVLISVLLLSLTSHKLVPQRGGLVPLSPNCSFGPTGHQ